MLHFGYRFEQKQQQRLEQSFHKEKSENFIFLMLSSKYTKKLEKYCKNIPTTISLNKDYYEMGPFSENTIYKRRKEKYDEYEKYDEFEEYDEYDDLKKKSKIKPEDYKKYYNDIMMYTLYFFNYVRDKIPKLSKTL